MQVFDGPIFEFLGNADSRETFNDLFFHRQSADVFLRAERFSAFGAMIVGIMEKLRVLHFFNRCFASWTDLATSVGKLEAAMAADNLVFFFGGHCAFALTTTNEAGERKFKV